MSSLEQLYQQVILDHSRSRVGRGPLDGYKFTSHQVNPTCGDEVTLGVSVDGAGALEGVAWEGEGCAISQASLSMMCELLQDAPLSKTRALFEAVDTMMHSRGQGVDDELLDRLGDAAALEGTSKFANRIKCSMLGWLALQDAMGQAGFDISSKETK